MVQTQRQSGGGDDATGDVVTGQVMKSPTDKIGRNEPCFCGSGKKFKLCHGRT